MATALNKVGGDPMQVDSPVGQEVYTGAPLMDIVAYGEIMQRVRNVVCRIVVPLPDRIGLGSGFLIGQGMIMTNHHVFEKFRRQDQTLEDVATHSKAQFFYERGGMIEHVAIRALMMEHAPLDFAIVRIDPSERIQRLQPLSIFNLNIPKRGDPAKIIQHPEGREKEISEHSVRAVWDNVVHYGTSTQQGSSGSPVIGAGGELFALHFWGRCLDHKNCNMGYLIIRIADYIQNARQDLFAVLSPFSRIDAPPIAEVGFADIVFGKDKWMRHLGCFIREAPPLPPDINAILSRPSPFSPGRTIAQTCHFVLMPRAVIGSHNRLHYLTPSSLEMFTKRPREGHPIGYRPCTGVDFEQCAASLFSAVGSFFQGNFSRAWHYWCSIGPEDKIRFAGHENDRIDSSYWALVTNDIVQETLEQPFEEQVRLIQRHHFEVPRLIEAATMMLTTYVETGFRVGGDTYTRCIESEGNEQMIIGNFTDGGPTIYSSPIFTSLHSEIGGTGDKVGVRAVLRFGAS